MPANVHLNESETVWSAADAARYAKLGRHGMSVDIRLNQGQWYYAGHPTKIYNMKGKSSEQKKSR